MIPEVKCKYASLMVIRADKGYRGDEIILAAANHGMSFTCTKSNGGGALFIPAQGRWVRNGHSHGSTTAGVLYAIMKGDAGQPLI